MARGKIGRLNTSQLRTKKVGLIADGGCLYIRTTLAQDGKSMNRGWIFRYQLPGGKTRDMGLGSLDCVGLAMARKLAADNRELVATGVDPIMQRKEIVAARRVAEAVQPPPTFDLCARDYVAAHGSGWKKIHTQQWANSIRNYASPVIGRLPVNAITVDHVLRILKPHWYEKTETMSRVRGRVEAVLDFAAAMKQRAGDNPARWSGNLKHLLASPQKVAKVEHFAALDYKRIGEFVTALRERPSIVALAFEFLILTAARTGEVIGATWDEIDMDEALWVVPANRMKAGREHIVPLSKAAMIVLHTVREITLKSGGTLDASAPVFPSDRTGKGLSTNALTSLLRRMKYDVTTHGMRSAFRDWAGEESHFPSDVIEMALAHSVGTKVEQAYRRKTGFQKRRLLAEAWAGYIAKPAAKEAQVLAFAKP